jgi:hypothetical protein
LHFWWQVQQSLMRYGDQSIVFSDLVYKFNRSNKMQQRVLIITDQALYVRELSAVSFCNNPNMYVMNDVKLSICRRITLQELGGVSYSSIGDDFMVVHVPSHYDYLLSCSRKREATEQLQLAYRQKLGRSVCVRVYGHDDALSGSRWQSSVWDPKGRFGKDGKERIISGTNHFGLRKTLSTLKKKRLFMFGSKASMRDPLYDIQSEQLISLLLTPHHPLGKQFIEFAARFQKRFGFAATAASVMRAEAEGAALQPQPPPTGGCFVTMGDDPRISVKEVSMTNAISGRRGEVGVVHAPLNNLCFAAVIRDFFSQKMTAVNGVLQEHKFKLSDGQLNHALQMAIFPSILSTIMPLVHQQNADMDALILRTAATIKGNQLPALDYLKVGPKLLHLLLQGVSNAGIFSSAQSPAADAGSGDMAFDVPADCMRLPFWPVYRMLYALCETPTPMKKLVIVNTAISLISSCVSLYSANAITLNGDDLLPILTYCVAMSGLQHPLAEMNFVAEFVTMGEPTSEQMFCLNQFEIALALMQQLQRDLPDIESHVISEGDIASALALAASSRPEDDDDDDSEEEVRCLKLLLLLLLLLLLPNVRLV